MSKKFYITTTLPYVNADPHIGFALEIIQADVVARWFKLTGSEVVFNTGTDEHGQKIYQKALESGMSPKEYCDEYAAKFDGLKMALDLSYTNFIRTTDVTHIKAAQEFWKICYTNGDIYKKNYAIKYCVGCELEKTDSELVEGKCPIHPTRELEIIEEENYFFRFSKYQNKLLEFYKNNQDFVIPEGKYTEIKRFVENGLEDFSVSRLKTKMPWGIDIPGDDTQVMYVWFDALINYISTLGWPNTESKYKDFWPGIQVAGKDNLRQQTAMWQAMLMSAGLLNSKQVFIHGFVTLNGQKISKSLGNTVDPIDLVNKYGTDAVRYYLLAKVHPWEDNDFTLEKFVQALNADLANGLGNLVARVAKLCEKAGVVCKTSNIPSFNSLSAELKHEDWRFDEAMKIIWEWIGKLDQKIELIKPWTLTGDDLNTQMQPLAYEVIKIAIALSPFMPSTSERIIKQFTGDKVITAGSLFPRIDYK